MGGFGDTIATKGSFLIWRHHNGPRGPEGPFVALPKGKVGGCWLECLGDA